MTDEFKGEEKESKSEKETDRVDKEFLSKAKNSRDMIDKKLRTFENSIEDISETITNGESVEEKEIEEKELEEVSQEVKNAQENLKNLNKDLTIEGVLLTMYDNRLNLSHQVAEEVRTYFKEKVYKTVISRNVRLGEAPSFGKPIIMYDAICSGSRNYLSLAEEMLKHDKKKKTR